MRSHASETIVISMLNFFSFFMCFLLGFGAFLRGILLSRILLIVLIMVLWDQLRSAIKISYWPEASGSLLESNLVHLHLMKIKYVRFI